MAKEPLPAAFEYDDAERMPKPVPRPSLPPSAARALRQALVVPDFINDGAGKPVPLSEVAQALANDTHEGDDVFHPQHAILTAREVVDLKYLSREVKRAGGTLALNRLDLVRACCEDGRGRVRMGRDGLVQWLNFALGDLGRPEFIYGGGQDECDAACMVLILAVLLWQEAQPEPPPRAKRVSRPSPMSPKTVRKIVDDAERQHEAAARAAADEEE